MGPLTDTEPRGAEELLGNLERLDTHFAVDKNWMHTARLLNRMATELKSLRGRCLCRGSFRCTPCLEEMEADGTHTAEVDETRGDMLRTLELLRLLPVATPITCHMCGGGSPEPEFCGCGGKQTVGEAIRWYESQLEILSK